MKLNKLIFAVLIVLCGSLVFPAGAVTDWPEQICAPYIDYGLWQGITINEAYDATGVKYYTCCFITVNSANELRFADHKEADWRIGDINALRAKGGDVIISFGGADGGETEPAIKIKDLDALVEAYSSVIDTYGVNYIDFDIEGAAVENPGATSRRNQAIIRLKEKYPDLKVSTTLAVTPVDGFNGHALAYLNDVKSAEDRYKDAHPGKEVLIFDRVNIMLMDYGPWYVKDPDKMGEYGIDAANTVHQQLKQGYYKGKSDAEIWKRMGLTPMIGQNDSKDEVFYPKDARQVAEFAGEKGIGLMSIWSLSRDQGGCDGQFPPSATCSSIPQEKFEFTSIIKNFPSMRPSAVIAATDWPKQIYAPYIDVALNTPETTITSIAEKTGVKYFTLAFVNAGENNEPMWAWRPNGYYRDQVDAIRAKGGDVIISFGGANGQTTELAITTTDVTKLTGAYRSVIDTYGVNYIDFDIEGIAVHNNDANSRRNEAIKRLQESEPNLQVSFTLAVSPSGFPPEQMKLLRDAKSAGVRIDRVNLMLMDYGPAFPAPDPDGTMGQYGIDAANNVHRQLKEIFEGKSDAEIWKRMGLTPMIGQNDEVSEVFYLNDAKMVAEFAGSKGVGLMSIWSATRDNGKGGYAKAVDWGYSGIEQEDYEFSNIFKNYASMTYSPTETPEPTHATGLVMEWDSEKQYDTDDRVLHNGNIYAARWWTLGEEPGIEYVWMLVSDEPLPTPTPATGLVMEWDSKTVYETGDCVLHNGDMYAAKWLTTGEVPGVTYVWDLIPDSEPAPTPTPTTGLISQWDSKTVYEAGDTVLYKSNSYTARWRNAAEPPIHTYSWISDSGSYVPTPTPGIGPARPWDSRQVYAAGDTVLYKGNRYRASWINKNEKPIEAYVWELDSEEPIPVPTSTPTPTYATGLLPQPTHAMGLITPTPTPATGLLGG